MSSINWSVYPDFQEKEFTCNCGYGTNNISAELVKKLQRARDISRKITKSEFGHEKGVPFRIERGCSCSPHNTDVGGSATSSHIASSTIKCTAADLRVKNSSERFIIIKSLILAGFKRIGIYNAHNGIHCDVDPNKDQNVMWKV